MKSEIISFFIIVHSFIAESFNCRMMWLDFRAKFAYIK